MYTSLNTRFQVVLADCIERLEEMAPARSYQDLSRAPTPSSASSPSLRAKESVVVPMSPTPTNSGGNVKVVVRVRGFLQRGELLTVYIGAFRLTLDQNLTAVHNALSR